MFLLSFLILELTKYALNELENDNLESTNLLMQWFFDEIKPAIFFYSALALLYLFYYI